ncbi:hypothetical protein MPTK1_2g15560 [Marchantia polymorpha subsp. ruderalis]|uniref:Uncharacterized protein n=1 Tax=Marchantia polymorpha TaxID=3197 RepID=A0A2R6WK38_MARPO|nr:hypothetical protein MARPO_0082s0053 [Marchantia polymorpha]BBN02461.1 hypothetical protein Mp_2g15560 [Marchantia polymorpha subsp. ruderalis]|eukprot:PTQ34209.1 hypothetical protein MARPO_0082s0053 [Marchantia polymorpha]
MRWWRRDDVVSLQVRSNNRAFTVPRSLRYFVFLRTKAESPATKKPDLTRPRCLHSQAPGYLQKMRGTNVNCWMSFGIPLKLIQDLVPQLGNSSKI